MCLETVVDVEGVQNLEAGLNVLRCQIGGAHCTDFTAWDVEA
jgi:hypothetical protein